MMPLKNPAKLFMNVKIKAARNKDSSKALPHLVFLGQPYVRLSWVVRDEV